MNTKDVDLLRRSDLFRFLPDEHFEKIRPLLQEERHDFGDLIVKQGDPASAFYILISGRARVVKSGANNGEEIVLATLRPGDSFGEAALTEGGTRTATVRCSTSVEVLRLDRAEFLALTETAPEFKEYMQVTRRARTLQSFLYEFSNFGRLPTPALREVIEKLERVQFRKGNLIIKEGDSAGPMYILEKGRARAFTQNNGAQVNLAFYRDGDFFGELSILNGSPRAASVEAYSDCDLLALDPDAVRSLKQSYPEFGKLLEERLAQYKAKTEARIPLDFTEELVPAETLAHNKVALDGKFAVKEKEGAEAPFADDEGHFRKKKRRIRKFEHITQIDEMDCGAASLGMICR
ncbi:MAG: cyclic nucleotide-binding domain-containing protein, partial [Verrucomicrobia bacterium]